VTTTPDSRILCDKMSAIKPAGNLRAASPPLKKTEERRRRSSSRQRIDSEFIRKVDDIPVVHNTMEYLYSTYGVMKDVNPLVKNSLERSEDIAFWIRQKTNEVVKATKMEEPLKKLDSAAANSVDKVEKTGNDIRQRINDTNKDVQARIKTERQKLEKKTAAAESAFFESIQTMMDHLEQRFEPVMLKPSPDVEKYSTEPSAQMTLARTIDMTYRLNLGILHYSAAKAKELTNADAWTAAMRKHFSPSQIRVRANIIRQAAIAPPSQQLKYMENKELTELDRRLITLSRSLIEAASQTVDSAKQAPTKFYGAAVGSIQYAGGVLKHISEARSINDLTGITMNESRILLEGVRDNVPFVNNFGLLDSAISWTAAQEKAVSSK